MQLLEANVDHFGVKDSQTYDAGHTITLELVSNEDLNKTLAVNGFVDHFFHDSLPAGCIRVPRREIVEISKHHAYPIPNFFSDYKGFFQQASHPLLPYAHLPQQ
ncbi:hypothetical protein FSARC_12185 [Fusarium sarcochroum]|uniref:Uncharacterized protein n=1 Tax=Fusarium sarcochroum TaxID=1208366 RepID=A0A8H4WY54_9HYPO|nr:hypothetical protein FSARC_12185 [Fusarium sarcochroum]